MKKWTLISIRVQTFKSFLTTFKPRCSLATASSFDHGTRIPATQETGGQHLGAERSHRILETRGEYLEHHIGQDCVWLRQCSSYNDKGAFPALLQLSAPGLHPARTQWSMNRIASSLDYLAPISAERSTGG